MNDATHDTSEGGEEQTLENQFLIAMPHLQDPYFNGSVTYLWKHGPDGALGIVINRPSDVTMTELLAELEITPAPSEARLMEQEQVLAGGPVERNKGFILHEAGDEWDYTLPVTDEIAVSMSRDILEAIAEGRGPDHYLVSLGCAGWEAGQLEQEISDNVWLTVPADSNLLFSRDFDNKASAAAAILGIDLSQLSSIAGHS
ncbi:MAG: YqgE/AlgH family protein [Pseudohongiellaceae bacterium]